MRFPALLALQALCGAVSASSAGGAAHGLVDLPAAFVANHGQHAAEVLFHVRDGAVELGFERGAFWLRPAGESRRLCWRIDGAAEVLPTALGPPRARFHFLRGTDAAGWLGDVPAFGGVRYAGLRPGVDLVVYAARGSIEYDLELAPGASLADVRLSVEGADALELVGGDLIVRLGASSVRQLAPESREVHADGRTRTLASRCVPLGAQAFGFEVDGRDPAAALVVDPVLVYSRSLGGAAAEAASAVASDEQGNLYVAGWSASDDFPLTGGAFAARRGGREACAFKLDPEGELVWASFLGGDCDDEAYGIAVDGTGSPVIVGRTKSSDFPISVGAWRPGRAGLWDAFVARLDPSGAALVYGTFLGGSDEDVAVGVALGRSGNAYVVGTTRSKDFPCTSHALKGKLEGISDAFLVKLDQRGAVPIYATLLGGTREDRGTGVALDALGHAYVAGVAHSQDFPTTRGAFDETRNGVSDAFVAQLGFDGGALVWSTFLGGASEDEALSLAVASNGAVSVGGWTSSADFPSSGPEVAPAGRDAFVARLAPSGSKLEWSRLLGGSGAERCHALALAGDGTLWAAGETSSADLPTRQALQPEPGGGSDGWLAQLRPLDGATAFATYFGGAGNEALRGVALARAGRRVAVVGSANGILPSARGLLGAGEEAPDDALVALLSLGACGSNAARELVGPGCGASLTCDLPRVGDQLVFRLSSAAPRAEGVLLWSPPAETPFSIEGWCEVPLDILQLDRPRPLRTDADGAARVLVEVPADPALCGRTFVFQALILAPQRGPLGFGALSQPLLLTFGD